MTIPSPSEKILFADTRRQRFLDEIAAHADDSGGNHVIGDMQTLTTNFNMYVIERRRHAMIRYLIIILSIAMLTSYSMLYIHLDHGRGGWELLVAMPGLLLALLPVLLFTVFTPVVWLKTIWLVPIVSTILWAVVVYMLTFNPPAFIARFSRK